MNCSKFKSAKGPERKERERRGEQGGDKKESKVKI